MTVNFPDILVTVLSPEETKDIALPCTVKAVHKRQRISLELIPRQRRCKEEDHGYGCLNPGILEGLPYSVPPVPTRHQRGVTDMPGLDV